MSGVQQAPRHMERGRAAEIVGVGLETQAEQTHAGVGRQLLEYAPDESVLLFQVHLRGGAGDMHRDASLTSGRGQHLKLLRKAGAAKAKPRLHVDRSDARVERDPVENLLDLDPVLL